MEVSRILGALQATWHDLYETIGVRLSHSDVCAVAVRMWRCEGRAELRLHASEVRFETVLACCRRTATQVRRGVRARDGGAQVLPWGLAGSE